MDHIGVKEDIEKIIEAIKIEGKESVALIKAKALAMAKYDEEIAKSEAALKATGSPVTLVKNAAKGKCTCFLYDKIVAEESLKAHYSRLGYLEAQLNGYQSIFRHIGHANGTI